MTGGLTVGYQAAKGAAGIGAVEEPPRRTPVRFDTDVLVVGGGSAGILAAMAAARLGVRVLLAERNGYLGGTLTAVTLGSFCGLYTVTEQAIHPIIQGTAGEFLKRLAAAGGLGRPQRWLQTASRPYDPIRLRLVADDVLGSCAVSLVFHSVAVGVLQEGRRVAGVIFEGRDGRWACRARTVIDCSGDGDIATLAGADFELDLATMQAPTMMFRLGGVDTARARRVTRADLHACLERAVAAGLDLPRTAGGTFSMRPHSMHLNITKVTIDGRVPNPLDTVELSRAEVEGRRQLDRYLDAFRRFVPGYEHSYIEDIGAHIGVRESRRIVADYRLSSQDVLIQARFQDAVACGAWPMENHDTSRGTKWRFLEPGTYYQIPYRALLPRGLEGLLVAGRCASAEHDAHASMRVAGICMALGEAAGTAAALAVQRNVAPRSLSAATLQAQLEAQHAFLGRGPLPPPVAE